MRSSFALLLLTLISNAQEIKVSSGSLKYFADFKSEYINARPVAVWLPDGYSDNEKYDVLYMHDGQSLFDADATWNKQEWNVDETSAKLIAQSETKKFIVVAIWNGTTNRHSEYFPQKVFESLSKKQQDSLYLVQNGTIPLFGNKVNSDAYLKFIVKELMPFVEHTYSVNKGKEHTFIAGSSMGGLISLYAMCEYPDVFGGAACLSTHWIGTFEPKNNPITKKLMDYLKRNLPSPMKHKIYFDYGDQTLDAYYEPHQREVDLILMAKGYDDRNWMTKKFAGADHSEKAWAQRLEVPLLFLFGK